MYQSLAYGMVSTSKLVGRCFNFNLLLKSWERREKYNRCSVVSFREISVGSSFLCCRQSSSRCKRDCNFQLMPTILPSSGTVRVHELFRFVLINLWYLLLALKCQICLVLRKTVLLPTSRISSPFFSLAFRVQFLFQKKKKIWDNLYWEFPLFHVKLF